MIGAHQSFVTVDRHVNNIPVIQRSGFISKLVGGSELILSRRMCSFRSKVIEEGALTTKMMSALVLETLAHSSYKKTGIYITFIRGVVNIWTWDVLDVEDLSDVPARHAVPETLFHTPEDGFRLRACLEGYEGQFWQNKALVSSRWWPDIPKEQDWENFVRAGGSHQLSGYATQPETIEQGIALKTREHANRVPLSYQAKQLSPSVFLLVGLAIISVAFVFFCVRNFVVELEKHQYQAERAVLDQATSEKRVLRRQLIQKQKELDTYNSIFRANEPLSAISAIAETILDIGAEITQIDFAEGQIDVRFEVNDKFSQRDLVQKLEASKNLKQVSVTRLGLTGIWTIVATSDEKGQADD